MTDNRQQTTDLRPKTKIEPRILNGEAGVLWRVTKHKPVLSAVEGLRTGAGSALILAVVLTSLLAVLGMMFVMVARVDRIATSAISENKELNYAVETVIAKISQELVLDVPGVGGQLDYYDYPDGENAWLASLEPYDSGGYKWRQISNIAGMGGAWGDLQAEIIADYQQNIAEGTKADADGDGVADSKWVELDDISSNKGRAIYAAIRIIDNGAMLNVNTAYKFDPNSAVENEIDGSSQMQINLEALARVSDNIDDIDEARNPYDKPHSDYQDEVIWKIEDPCNDYLPFDISDELELRNRFFLTTLAKTRLEDTWFSTIGHSNFKTVPYDGRGVYDEDHWWRAISQDANQPDRRHFLTTYNMDRIIRPDGRKMLNINDPCVGVGSVYDTVKTALGSADPNSVGDVNDIAAQIAVNLIDYRDTDSNVTAYLNPDDGTTYYGFERPCIYISELAHNFVSGTLDGAPIVFRSYAIELHKPYLVDDYPDPNQWRLVINNYSASPIPVVWSGTQRFHVLLFEDPNAPLVVDFESGYDDPNLAKSEQKPPFVRFTEVFDRQSVIELQRLVDSTWVTVDDKRVPRSIGDWLQPDVGPQSIQRDITRHRCIGRLWSDRILAIYSPSLGSGNSYIDASPEVIQTHPENRPFTNIGEIGMIFRKGAYYQDIANRDERIGYGTNKTEADVRLDLADTDYHNLFKYLTVFDPTTDGINNDGDRDINQNEIIDESDPNKPYETPEFKIPGRININTAPWFVIAQLPWMTETIAQAIVNDRDTQDGFESIGELMLVDEMGYYANDANEIGDLAGFPDLTPGGSTGDDAADDFEERDVIFARISNLVTVRSDVFTAYILVRVGADGPQKRAIAILDRSDVYPPDGGKVRIVALHPVPDPR